MRNKSNVLKKTKKAGFHQAHEFLVNLYLVVGKPGNLNNFSNDECPVPKSLMEGETPFKRNRVNDLSLGSRLEVWSKGWMSGR